MNIPASRPVAIPSRQLLGAGLVVLVVAFGVVGYALGRSGRVSPGQAAAARSAARAGAYAHSQLTAYNVSRGAGYAEGLAIGRSAGAADGQREGADQALADGLAKQQRQARASGKSGSNQHQGQCVLTVAGQCVETVAPAATTPCIDYGGVLMCSPVAGVAQGFPGGGSFGGTTGQQTLQGRP